MSEAAGGIHLTRTEENVEEIDALASLLGGRVGLPTVLSDLNRRGHRSVAPGRAVRRSYTWDRADGREPAWWPQGISTSADASDTEDVEGRRLLAVSWYSKEHGSRVSVFDLGTRRYRHVLLVVPTLTEGRVGLEPLRVHAGGLVWCGPYLHVAATSRGVVTCRLDDILRVPDHAAGVASRLEVDGARASTFGYRYVLPVRFAYRAMADEGRERLRYSFLSLDRSATPPELVVGEYGNSRQTRRLARFPLDPETLFLAEGEDGVSRPVVVDEGGAVRTQGAAIANGAWYLTASTGRWMPGSVYAGQPGSFRRHRWATPMGPEDLSWWPSTDLLWSVTEHPRRRWIYAMPRSWFDTRGSRAS
jgi:hypothetical protein